MFFETIINYVGLVISQSMSKLLAYDYWYRLGMGVNIGGITLSALIPDSIMLFSSGLWDNFVHNPVKWVTAICVVAVNLVAIYQKFEQNRREEEKHKQDLEQEEEKHKADLKNQK